MNNKEIMIGATYYFMGTKLKPVGLLKADVQVEIIEVDPEHNFPEPGRVINMMKACLAKYYRVHPEPGEIWECRDYPGKLKILILRPAKRDGDIVALSLQDFVPWGMDPYYKDKEVVFSTANFDYKWRIVKDKDMVNIGDIWEYNDRMGDDWPSDLFLKIIGIGYQDENVKIFDVQILEDRKRRFGVPGDFIKMYGTHLENNNELRKCVEFDMLPQGTRMV